MKQRKRPVLTKAELLQLFWSAPDQALLDRKTVAVGLARLSEEVSLPPPKLLI